MNVVFFHRNLTAGYSINKVTQTIIRDIPDKVEYFAPLAGASLRALVRNFFFVWKNRKKNAINHVTGDIHYCILALFGCKSVLTVHDTVSLDYNQLPPIKRLIIEYLWFRLPIKMATKVVCISESTKEYVERYTKRKDIVVIHNAVDPLFLEEPLHTRNDVPTVLLIGTSSNKNLVRTFEALKGQNCKVVIVGKLSKEQLDALDDNHINYINKVGLTDAQILEEYKNCDIVSFISLFEGFGMIVVEANKVGRPVICSDIPVLKEVAGDSALLVNPCDVEDMRKGFEKMFSDNLLGKSLVKRGFENAKRFDADNIRKQWIAFYRSIS